MRIKKANTFQWDANGNMTKQGSNIYLQWDEKNRLKSVSKPAQGVCFFYDASGERFYKNSGQKQMMLVNGSYYMNIPFYDSPVLYTSPYVVVTRDGYTKHYFIENERFASRIGDGAFSDINTHTVSNTLLTVKQTKVNDEAPDSIRPNELTILRNLTSHWSAHHTTYWQHSDHIGSANWVSDTNGAAYQHLLYMPWGEPLLDQRATTNGYNTRYTFSGKERDEETGYSYFGARYYNSDLSLWLSVDPMADKYPGVSPYAYCANNPIKLVDPNGMEYTIPPFVQRILQTAKDLSETVLQEKAKGCVSAIRNGAVLYNNRANSNKSLNISGTYHNSSTNVKKTDTDQGSANKFNMYVNYGSVFYVDESDASYYENYESHIVASMMDGFVNGTGPENYDFPENGIISSMMLQSNVVQDAIDVYKKTGKAVSRQFSFRGAELFNNLMTNNLNPFNIEGLVGSAYITVTPAKNGMLSITVFNITSITSGDYTKEITCKSLYPKSIMRSPTQKTPFGNISQTFHLLIPYN